MPAQEDKRQDRQVIIPCNFIAAVRTERPGSDQGKVLRPSAEINIGKRSEQEPQSQSGVGEKRIGKQCGKKIQKKRGEGNVKLPFSSL